MNYARRQEIYTEVQSLNLKERQELRADARIILKWNLKWVLIVCTTFKYIRVGRSGELSCQYGTS
jgi:hypothetical protein